MRETSDVRPRFSAISVRSNETDIACDCSTLRRIIGESRDTRQWQSLTTVARHSAQPKEATRACENGVCDTRLEGGYFRAKIRQHQPVRRRNGVGVLDRVIVAGHNREMKCDGSVLRARV